MGEPEGFDERNTTNKDVLQKDYGKSAPKPASNDHGNRKGNSVKKKVNSSRKKRRFRLNYKYYTLEFITLILYFILHIKLFKKHVECFVFYLATKRSIN